jgi:hypothetical protein
LRPYPFLTVMAPLLMASCLSAGAAPNRPQSTSASKTVIAKTGETSFEAPLPQGIPLRMYLRSGEIRLLGAEGDKITVEYVGRNAHRAKDVKHRLTLVDGSAEFRVSGGPRNDLQITIRVPRNCDLFVRVPAGDVTVEGILGNKDIELHAGDLSIQIGNPDEYSHVDASVSVGDVNASPFGESHGGLFRSFKRSGSGKYKLHAHVGSGDLTLL